MIFWIFSLALLSWPLRVLIQYKTAYVHYQVNKLFGVNYLTPSSEAQMIGHMSRGTTIDSSEFERQILNNNTIAPSYSESLMLRSSSSFTEQNRNLIQYANQSQNINENQNTNQSQNTNQTQNTNTNQNHLNRSSSRRYSTGIPVSISRSSLQNGRVVYYVSPLEDVSTEIDRRPTEEDLNTNEEATPPPPSYDDALRHCRPLFLPLRRSITDRDIQRRLPMVFLPGVHQGHQRDRIPLGENIEENEPESVQTSLWPQKISGDKQDTDV